MPRKMQNPFSTETKEANNSNTHISLEVIKDRRNVVGDSIMAGCFKVIAGSSSQCCTLCVIPDVDPENPKPYQSALKLATIAWHHSQFSTNRKSHLVTWHWRELCEIMVNKSMDGNTGRPIETFFGGTGTPPGIKTEDYVKYCISLALASCESSFRTADNIYFKESYGCLGHKGISRRAIFRTTFPKIGGGIDRYLLEAINSS
jgi:hypothetical protein